MISDFRLKKKNLQSTISNQQLEGFTLIEVLIYTGLLLLVVVSLVQFTLSISEARNTQESSGEVQANARVALDLISRKIRAANGVNTSTSVFGADPGFLSLSMASSTLNPTLISLSANDGVLVVKEGTGATTTVTSDEVQITRLVFTNNTVSSTRENIGVDMTIRFAASSTPDFAFSESVSTSVSVRQ